MALGSAKIGSGNGELTFYNYKYYLSITKFKSSETQFIFYFCTFILLFLLFSNSSNGDDIYYNILHLNIASYTYR